MGQYKTNIYKRRKKQTSDNEKKTAFDNLKQNFTMESRHWTNENQQTLESCHWPMEANMGQHKTDIRQWKTDI